jgi:hypothetical protein
MHPGFAFEAAITYSIYSSAPFYDSVRSKFKLNPIFRTSHRSISDMKRLNDVDDGVGFNVDVSEEQRQLISSLLALANENPSSKSKRFSNFLFFCFIHCVEKIPFAIVDFFISDISCVSSSI